MRYAIEMTRHQAALFFAGEYGVRGALRIMRRQRPFGDSDTPFKYVTRCGRWWRYDTELYQRGRRHTKRCAEAAMTSALQYIAYNEGRLGQPLSGSAGVMRIIEL